MKIAVACGGTGGHIFPGLAVASELRERGHEVTLWLGGRDVEQLSAEGWDGPVERVRSAGLSGMSGIQTIISLFQLAVAVRKSKKLMRVNRPDAVLAMGSYASVGPVVAASRLGVPVILHEGNAVPGRAIRFLSRYASEVALSFEGSETHFDGVATTVTGFPLRKSVLEPRSSGRTGGALRILVMGGSQGAHAVNDLVSNAICNIHRDGAGRVTVCHLTGQTDEAEIRARYEEAGVAGKVQAFSSDMAEVYSSSDFAVCRAGAASCAELAARRVPCLLIPLPSAINDHQSANARSMQKDGCADVLAQCEIQDGTLERYLEEVLQNPARLETMKRADIADDVSAAAQVADVVERIGSTI